jgi:guanylate kinase
MPDDTGRLVILSGPSCVGKSPLRQALARWYPEEWRRLRLLVLFNSRAPRPGERDGIDYHFRTRREVEELASDARYAVIDVRGDLQALDLVELQADLARGNVFFEGNPYVARVLQNHPALASVARLSIFLSPLSQDEIASRHRAGEDIPLPAFVTDLMRGKLLRRARRQKGEPSPDDLRDIETRASRAYRELTDAWRFDHVIPNQDGEDSDHWDAPTGPTGDARAALDALVSLLRGVVPPNAERWDPTLVSPLPVDQSISRATDGLID